MARRYARDNRGRFASKGTGATARGGRLKTAGGSKRQTQTMQASAAPRAGAIRGKVKRDPTAAGRVGQQSAAKPKATSQLRPGATMRANAFPRNAIAKSALEPTGNPYGYGDTRQGNIRAAVRQAKEAGVPIKIDRRRNPSAMATYSDANQAITIYARSSGWANRSATAIARRRSNFSSSSKPEGLMAHEIAHARSKTLTSGSNWRSVAQQAQVRLGEGWDQMRPIRQIANRVSAYARENPQEFIAEFRAARAAGRRFDPEVVRLYRAAAGVGARPRRQAR